MLYKVIKFFTDLQDNEFAYNVGDTFPRKGKIVSEKRLKELASANNKQGVPLIVKEADEEPVEADETAETNEKPKKNRKKA